MDGTQWVIFILVMTAMLGTVIGYMVGWHIGWRDAEWLFKKDPRP